MKLCKKLLVIPTLILSLGLLTGCEEVQIFKTTTDPYALVAHKDTDLNDNVYYVKNNTNFYSVYRPKNGNSTSAVSALNESRVFITLEDESLIPTFYADELIAFQSDSIGLTGIMLERFIPLGYSVGCFGGSLTDDDYLYFHPNENLAKNSSLAAAIGSTNSKDIRISSIDGKPLSREQVNRKTGTIKGLEQNKSYKLGFYLGTKYKEKKVTADCKIYEAYEMFSYGKDYIYDTPNGYMAFSMPDDLKSGYYNINGAGLFKYFDFNRGEMDEDEIDMCESYYLDDKSKIEAYSRQYSVSVPKRVKDLKITVKMADTEKEYADDIIQGIVFAPDGTKMEMSVDEDNKEMTIALAEGMAGDWTINVIPKTLNIKDVKVDNDKAAEEATCEETVFSLPEDRENIEFIAEVKSYKPDISKCTLFGTVLDENGKTYEMEISVDERNQNNPKYYIKYEIPYAAAGDYIVRIYHHPEETQILTPTVKDKTETDTEIIIVDG